MMASRDFAWMDNFNLNLDAVRSEGPVRTRHPQTAKHALSPEDIFTHVNIQALEALGMQDAQAAVLKFTVAPRVNPFKGETNWRVMVDPRATEHERSAIEHAAQNVQRIFDLKDGYQNVRALIV